MVRIKVEYKRAAVAAIMFTLFGASFYELAMSGNFALAAFQLVLTALLVWVFLEELGIIPRLVTDK